MVLSVLLYLSKGIAVTKVVRNVTEQKVVVLDEKGIQTEPANTNDNILKEASKKDDFNSYPVRKNQRKEKE